MELSQSKLKEAKKFGVSHQFLIMADLIAIGYSDADAYTIAYPENEALSVQRNNSIRTSITDSIKFKKLLGSRIAQIKNGIGSVATLDDVELVGTESVLKEILRSARHQPMGSKERADLFAKYNDIRRETEQGVDEDFEAISFYFPVKCNQCPLMEKFKGLTGDETVKKGNKGE